MIIEFAGLPGCGKSTAADLLLATAAEHGIPAGPPVEPLPTTRWARLAARPLRSGRSAAFLLLRPGLSHALLRELRRSRRSRAEKWFALRHVAVTVQAMARTRRSAPPGTMTVFHEGLCQRAFFAFVDGAGASEAASVRRFVANAPRPDVVVFLRVDPDVSLARVRARDHGALSYRFDGLSEDELRQRLLEGQDLLLDTAEFMETDVEPAVRGFVLDSDDLPAALERLRTEVFPRLAAELRSNAL